MIEKLGFFEVEESAASLGKQVFVHLVVRMMYLGPVFSLHRRKWDKFRYCHHEGEGDRGVISQKMEPRLFI